MFKGSIIIPSLEMETEFLYIKSEVSMTKKNQNLTKDNEQERVNEIINDYSFNALQYLYLLT